MASKLSPLPSPAFDALLKQASKRLQTRVVVRCDEGMPGGRAAYKLHVDGNVAHTPPVFEEARDAAAGWIIPAAVGEHRVVVREFDAQRPGRLESNTLRPTVQAGQETRLALRRVEGALVLAQETLARPPVVAPVDLPDLAAIEDALVALSLEAIARFAAEHPEETFYAFGFDCNADHGGVLLCLNTEAAFEETAAIYRERWNYSAQQLADLKRNFGDWQYQGFNQDEGWKETWAPYSRAILEVLGGDVDEEDRQRAVEELMRCFCRALLRVEQAGALEALRREPGFYAQVVDHDEDEEQAAQRLAAVRAEAARGG